MSGGRMRVAAVVCGVLGVVLLIPFESPVTLTLGVLFLFAFIVVGTFAVAGPGFVDGDRRE